MERKLLIVDDEPKIYHALRRALHRESDWVTLYANGADEALELLGKETVDVVIADENMPGMNGSQLLGLVRQRWPEIIRMMLTGDPRIDVVMNAVNNGEIYRFFTKPCNESELIVSIREALQMRELKQGSRELLETVKKQSAQIRDLQTGDTPADIVSGGPEADAQPADAVRPTISLGGTPTPVSDGVKKGEFDIEADADVDSLLSDIRNELDTLT
jgi:two-component system probable response regulator PhcQ